MPTIDPKHVSDDVRALNPQLFGKEEAAQAAPLAAPPTGRVIRLLLPMPPSANRYWRNTNTGSHVSREAREYKELVKNGTSGVEMLHGRLSLTLVYYGLPKIADMDNRIKVLVDSLKGIAYVDDASIYHLEAFRSDETLRKQMVGVTVREYTFNGKPATYSDGGVEDYGGPQADERGVPSNLPVLREPDT